NNRGNSLSSNGEYDKAIADFTKSIKLGPDSKGIYANRAHYNRGNAYFFKG
ncbi:MAG: tetratricopeptide repeat protein, partial [bacterium]|nr:tetratricopeptide repeat protein [bacterium]